jgi:hypothetical protein
MKHIHVVPFHSREEMAHMEGAYCDLPAEPKEQGWVVLEGPEDARVVAGDTGHMLCRVMRRAIPAELCATAVRCFMDAGRQVSTNRGTAAGMPSRRPRGSPRSDDAPPTYERGNPAQSGIVGYMDSLRHDRPCRLTAFTRDHMDAFQEGMPFIHAIDSCFKTAAPDAYRAQREEAARTPFHLDGTAFSTVTVNLDFRTSLHRDAGDFEKGCGILVVCSHDIEGGWLLFPRYHVAVALETGDFLAMNVHEWHCNSPIQKMRPDGYRLSFVCYLRARMSHCAETNRRLALMPSNAPATADAIIDRIFTLAGEPSTPPKVAIGPGPRWWRCEGARFVIEYKHKRYVLHDKYTATTIHNLWRALEYAHNGIRA